MKAKLKEYGKCVQTLESKGLTRRQIAALIGIDEAVVSRRLSGKQAPTREALIVINTLAGIFAMKPGDTWRKNSWIAEKTEQAWKLRGEPKPVTEAQMRRRTAA
jgi:transcriptional regulator with XRE-family HTH domain